MINFRKVVLYVVIITLSSSLLNGCAAPSGLVIWASRPMIDGAIKSLMSETDLEFARSGFESNLKLIDGFLELKPNDYQLLTLATQGYVGYALIYLEDQSPERGSLIYDRSLKYGFRALSVAGYNLQPTGQNFKEFRNEVTSLNNKHINTVYWTAMAWAAKLNLNRSSIAAVTQYPRVLLLMEWILEQDPNYFYSGPLWFLGSYWINMPEMLMGGANRAKPYFDRALKADGNIFLLGKVWMAEYYSTQIMDRKQFLSILSEVVGSSQNEPAELRLINRYAQAKAAMLISSVDQLFD